MRLAAAVWLSLAIYLSLNDLGPNPVNAMSLAATQPGAQPLAVRTDDSVAAQSREASSGRILRDRRGSSLTILACRGT